MGPVPPFESLTENEIGSADENVPEFLFFSICCDDIVFVPIEVSLLVSLGPCVKHCHHFLGCLLMGIKSLLEFGLVLHFDLPKSEIKLEPRRLSMQQIESFDNSLLGGVALFPSQEAGPLEIGFEGYLD